MSDKTIISITRASDNENHAEYWDDVFSELCNFYPRPLGLVMASDHEPYKMILNTRRFPKTGLFKKQIASIASWSPGSRLLELPGELRNLIYYHCYPVDEDYRDYFGLWISYKQTFLELKSTSSKKIED